MDQQTRPSDRPTHHQPPPSVEEVLGGLLDDPRRQPVDGDEVLRRAPLADPALDTTADTRHEATQLWRPKWPDARHGGGAALLVAEPVDLLSGRFARGQRPCADVASTYGHNEARRQRIKCDLPVVCARTRRGSAPSVLQQRLTDAHLAHGRRRGGIRGALELRLGLLLQGEGLLGERTRAGGAHINRGGGLGLVLLHAGHLHVHPAAVLRVAAVGGPLIAAEDELDVVTQPHEAAEAGDRRHGGEGASGLEGEG
mmetsp:Transcript_4495/g.10396  ORF Transcript_4495/g.10396 Transcript_4495/m.10396 type:complete len:255 (-) Transcript_4495:1608-2372(-)